MLCGVLSSIQHAALQRETIICLRISAQVPYPEPGQGKYQFALQWWLLFFELVRMLIIYLDALVAQSNEVPSQLTRFQPHHLDMCCICRSFS